MHSSLPVAFRLRPAASRIPLNRAEPTWNLQSASKRQRAQSVWCCCIGLTDSRGPFPCLSSALSSYRVHQNRKLQAAKQIFGGRLEGPSARAITFELTSSHLPLTPALFCTMLEAHSPQRTTELWLAAGEAKHAAGPLMAFAKVRRDLASSRSPASGIVERADSCFARR